MRQQVAAKMNLKVFTGMLCFKFLGMLALRMDSASAQDLNLRHRSLAVFSTPFAMSIKISLNSSGQKRAPTSSEYNGIKNAAVAWFGDYTKQYYSNKPGITYTSTACQIDTSKTSYSPTASLPHDVALNCQAKFTADAITNIPTSVDLASSAATYPFNANFVSFYVIPNAPSDSLFKNTRRVSYTLIATPTTVRPTSAPAGASVQTMEAIIEWKIGIGNGITDRRPTQAEYTAFQQQATAYVRDQIQPYFDGQGARPTLTAIPTSVVSTNFAKGSTPFAHTIRLKHLMKFTLQPGDYLPHMMQWIILLRSTEGSAFQTLYLSKTTGLFKNAASMQWTVIDS